MPRGSKAIEVEGVACILREPRPTRFFRLEPLIARVLGPGIMRLLGDGIEVDDGDGGRRKITALDLLDAREDDSIAAGVGAAVIEAIVGSLAATDPDDLDDLCMGLLAGCKVGPGDVPDDDPAGARLYLDNAAGVSGRGLTWIAAQQIWAWFLPTLPGGDTVGPM